MPTGDVCIRDVIVTGTETTVLEAARLMRTHHVGNVSSLIRTMASRSPWAS
jgi:hypothetical protein